ncbi:uroporphyrinogen-III C-methyltransferase [Phytoactinopolyspora halotolerans]|uniref:Uroporphyrinogen-III C-methyltransferase n=1 Tax=Phytoactinopolyspora halotolerans TaxID=1981512 RepID=A0A6L9SAG9_9ACTN|nr:uroporphyrinogen-III C-methyltransferase [Phytoactinopolyspora halotolerans]NEE02365.1 uroporphyrinogen-III C-methyltransferase [Phytoactinopolyspora halotolerans]
MGSDRATSTAGSAQASSRYPLTLDVAGRRVVVVGGGPIAARRAEPLADAGADLLVVAPALCEPLAALVEQGRAGWQPRQYRAEDLDDAWLVHTATGDRAVDDAAATDAEAARIWCVRADDAAASAAWTPAVARVGDLIVAVSGGGDPGRARTVRNAVQTALETGRLPLRHNRGATTGSVALVGGGPGDPSLITTRGRQLLGEADVVVIDRLAPHALLDALDDDVLVIDVGKTPGNHPVPQDEINRLLIEHARAGKRVVRLKGGDPFVLGRGGEEAIACREVGVPVEVVPGVTSAVSVPAAVGIPVTHRGVSKQFTVISGHEGLDWKPLAAGQGTLVLLMGVSLLADTAAHLIEAGKDPATPAAVIEDGYGPRQRLTSGTLADIAERAAAVGAKPPAVVVVGDVAALAAQISG